MRVQVEAKDREIREANGQIAKLREINDKLKTEVDSEKDKRFQEQRVAQERRTGLETIIMEKETALKKADVTRKEKIRFL